MIYCELMNCPKRDCLRHYKNAPWGVYIKVRNFKEKKDESYKCFIEKEEELNETEECD